MTVIDAYAGRKRLAQALPNAVVTVENFLIDHPDAFSVKAKPRNKDAGGYTLEFLDLEKLGAFTAALRRGFWEG